MTEPATLRVGDCLELLRAMPAQSVDLVFTSPPYEAARTYGIDFALRGQAWVDWAVERYLECLRVCRGLVAWVVEGQTRAARWSATPALMMADLHRRGIRIRKPPVYRRFSIPGSGGREWLRNDYEFIVCASHGKLPWSDNTAMGHPPKYDTGGACSNRTADGRRYNQMKYGDPSPGFAAKKRRDYAKPKRVNPGNVISCKVGGGHMGSPIAHENEAPFPEKLAEFFVRSFCPPGGIVLDPFCGSGTTLAVAAAHGRRGVGIDIRESQIDLTRRRLGIEPVTTLQPTG